MDAIRVIGAGLAGCEAAWAIAQAGVPVELTEMKPGEYTPAHHREGFAELVCSNSLKAKRLDSARCGGLAAYACRRLSPARCRRAARSPWIGTRFPAR